MCLEKLVYAINAIKESKQKLKNLNLNLKIGGKIKMDKNAIIEAIEKMTVLELSELVKELRRKIRRKRFAAPVAAAAAPAAVAAVC